MSRELETVKRAILSVDLYGVLMDVQNGITSPGLAGMANSAIRRIDAAREAFAALSDAAPEGAGVQKWSADVVALLTGYGFAPEAATVFASAELAEYRAGECDCAELAPEDIVDLLMDVALESVEKWKRESVGRPFGFKDRRLATPTEGVAPEGGSLRAHMVESYLDCTKPAAPASGDGIEAAWSEVWQFSGEMSDDLRDALIELRAALASPTGVDEAMVERAMNARIPGGSQAWVWLFNCEGGMQPEEKHRDWFRRVLIAALAAQDGGAGQ